MTVTKIMVAVAVEASSAVNMFIYVIIHHDDLGFALIHGEKENLQCIINPALFEADDAIDHNGYEYHDLDIIKYDRGSLDIIVIVFR
jgi:hypothetical protein